MPEFPVKTKRGKVTLRIPMKVMDYSNRIVMGISDA